MVLMCDDLELTDKTYAEQGIIRLRDIDIPDWLVPIGLFYGRKECTALELIEWAKKRIFPSERMGADELLKELGIDRYEPWWIAKETRASLMDDWWWIKLSSGDKFETSSARGRAGYEPVRKALGLKI
jgi:hypothetical protein